MVGLAILSALVDFISFWILSNNVMIICLVS